MAQRWLHTRPLTRNFLEGSAGFIRGDAQILKMTRRGDDEPDYDGDAWADHYEGDGEIDTPEMREEFPEGFI